MEVKIMNEINYGKILLELKKRKYNFGQSLRHVRKEQKLTIRKVANEVNKTPTYISDIERGNNKPPEKELMEKIFNALKLQETEIKCYLYDLAARERGGAPADMIDYIMGHNNLRRAIREAQHREKGEEFWEECINNIS